MPQFWAWSEPAGGMTKDVPEGSVSLWEPLGDFDQEGQKTLLFFRGPGCRVAVRGQQSRATGILAGRGAQHALEVRFVDRTQGLTPGELLVTSGLDGAYPRGIPVARVLSAKATEYSQFMQVRAVPLVQMQNLEDVLLLEYKGILPPAERVFEEPAESPDSPLIQGPEPAPAS